MKNRVLKTIALMLLISLAFSLPVEAGKKKNRAKRSVTTTKKRKSVSRGSVNKRRPPKSSKSKFSKKSNNENLTAKVGNWAIKSPDENFVKKNPGKEVVPVTTDAESEEMPPVLEGETEAAGATGCDPGKICDEKDRRWKQQRAFERSKGTYLWKFGDIKKAGLVEVKPGKGITLSRAVTTECNWSKPKAKRAKRGRKSRRVCIPVSKPRNFTRPIAKKFLDVAIPIVVSKNDGRPIRFNSLSRDHSKQFSLMKAGYPTAMLTEEGYFLSVHVEGNSADWVGLSKEAKVFLYERFVGPWVDWDPFEKPVIIYFEGDQENPRYWERTGAVHIDFPATEEQYQMAIKLLQTTDENLPKVIAEIQSSLKANVKQRTAMK